MGAPIERAIEKRLLQIEERFIEIEKKFIELEKTFLRIERLFLKRPTEIKIAVSPLLDDIEIRN